MIYSKERTQTHVSTITLTTPTKNGWDNLIDCEVHIKVKYTNEDDGPKSEILEVRVQDYPKESELNNQAFEKVYLKPWKYF